MSKPPNPGSIEAQRQGCICPVLDNAHGKGFQVKGHTCFWFNGDCPLHNPKLREGHHEVQRQGGEDREGPSV